MPLLTPDLNPPRRQLRQFAWLAALLLALLTSRVQPGSGQFFLRLVAGCLFAAGTIWPGLLRWPYQALALLTWPIGWVAGHVLLAGIYFGLITPLGLLFRLWRRDGLQLRLEPEATTYWQPRRQVTDKQRYCRPF